MKKMQTILSIFMILFIALAPVVHATANDNNTSVYDTLIDSEKEVVVAPQNAIILESGITQSKAEADIDAIMNRIIVVLPVVMVSCLLIGYGFGVSQTKKKLEYRIISEDVN